jgi:hypothetical protein
MVSLVAIGKELSLSLPEWIPAILSIPWLIGGSLQSLPHHNIVFFPVSCVSISLFSLIKAAVIGVDYSLIQYE